MILISESFRKQSSVKKHSSTPALELATLANTNSLFLEKVNLLAYDY